MIFIDASSSSSIWFLLSLVMCGCVFECVPISILPLSDSFFSVSGYFSAQKPTAKKFAFTS